LLLCVHAEANMRRSTHPRLMLRPPPSDIPNREFKCP
jgi:hypothetical protein